MSFEDKVVLIIGASSRIGGETAVLFSKERANVVMVGRNEKRLSKYADQCKEYKPPFVIKADITNDDEATSVVAKTIEKFEKLDVLVYNAGIVSYGSVLDGNMLQAYDNVMKTNVRAMINITTLAAPYLVKTKGAVVSVSSVAASSAPKMATMNPYYVSKAAMNHFTRCAALELASHGVRVNTISPGPVRTDLLETVAIDDATLESFAKMTALQKMADTNEIAELIVFLSSNKARSITGSDYVIDNGYLLKN